jgi:hypothetical protein
MKKFCNFLNELFDSPKEFIINNNLNTNIRKSKISLEDAIFYRFSYIFNENSNTLQSITSSINFNNSKVNNKHKYFSRIGIYKKEKILPYQLYFNILSELETYYYNNFKEKNIIIAIDGVYSNTNLLHNGKVETSMSLGFYDISNSLPIDIHFTGEGKKNNECLVLIEYIKNNLDYFKKKLIICDRAYYNFSFFNFLIDNNIKFIIRLRDKAFETEVTRNSKHFNDYIKIKNNNKVQIITESFISEKLAVNNVDNLNSIKKETIVKLITNIRFTHKNEIIDLYKSRWNIEEFYKQLKHNFKFQNLVEHKDESYKKNIYCSLIITLIKQILLKVYEKDNEFTNKKIISKNKDKSKTVIKIINENLMLTGIKNELLKDIIYKKIKLQSFENYFNSYIKFSLNETERHNERKSKIPFSKWYVKQYHDVYKIKKKILDENISYYLKNNDSNIVSELKNERKKLNKEKKNLNKKIKDEILLSIKNNT